MPAQVVHCLDGNNEFCAIFEFGGTSSLILGYNLFPERQSLMEGELAVPALK